MSIVLEQIVIICFGICDQFSYPVQEFLLKNNTLKNGTSRISLNAGVTGPNAKSDGILNVLAEMCVIFEML